MDKDERLVDVIMFVVSLALSAFRFAKGQDPFDFESLPVAEFITSKALPFIENENVDYRKAHKDFIQVMVENGWKQGPEDFLNRTHQDITNWESLSQESREMYGYFAGIVCSARGFYSSLKNDLAEQFMDSLPSLAIRGKLITPDSSISLKATH